MQLSFADYLLYSLLGICVVFLVLVSLIVIIKLLTWATDRTASAGSAAHAVPAPATPVASQAAPAPALAPGSAGELKLNGVEPRTAAMLMAIVADELGVPLNELRFISIKEVDR